MNDAVFGELETNEYGFSLNRQFNFFNEYLPSTVSDESDDESMRDELEEQLGDDAAELLDTPLDEIDPEQLPESVQNSSLGFLLKHGEAIHSAMEAMLDDEEEEEDEAEYAEKMRLASLGILPISIETLGNDEPTAAQRAAYEFLENNEESVSDTVIHAIFEYYQFVQAEDPNWFDDWDCPEIDSPSDLAGLIEIAGVVVTPFESNGTALVGFQFQCDWDVERGLGVLLEKNQVIDVGEGEVAYEPREHSVWPRIRPAIAATATKLIASIQVAKDRAFDELSATEKLTHALIESNDESIEQLLAEGADINGAEYPALFVAIDQPDTAMIRRILDLGGNPQVEFEGQTPLQYALQARESVNQSKTFFVNLGDELIEELTGPGAPFLEEAEEYSDDLDSIIELLEAASARS
jgi:hypothetical protein